jgi:hypothetical protein
VPATRADEIHRVRPDLLVWQAYAAAVKCDLTSAAVLVRGELILVDPIPLAPPALEELLEFGVPRLIVCTSGNHARAAAKYREQFGAKIAAHLDGAADLELEIDVPLKNGSRLLEACEVCELPGGAPGEIALILPGKFICVGDALIHLPQTGFAVLPDKYCTDAKLLRQSLRNLLRYEFSTLTFAHGLPLVPQARSRLEALFE